MNIIEKYPKLPTTSAGRIMIDKIPVTKPPATISQIEKYLLKNTRDFETINYIYVKDSQEKLVGVLSVKEVFRTPKEAKAMDIMVKDLVTVRPHTDQERAALLAIKNNLKEIPVVDKDGRLLGAISNDTILRVLQEENVEDLLRFAGIHTFRDPVKDIIKAPASVHYKKRLPWLLVGLVGGFIAASIVSFFETSIKTNVIILASFIPVIAYMADAVGTQAQTIFIRSLALEQRLNLKKYLGRESRVAILLSLSLSFLAVVISYIFWGKAFLSIILGLSFLATTVIAIAVAIFLPWFFSKIRIDPAIASGPFATILRDILSLVIYFTIAKYIITSGLV